MNGTQNRIAIEHIQVLKTLHDAGNITRQQMKSIRGQIITMNACHKIRDRRQTNV